MECPKCGFVSEGSGPECPRCGLVFSKLNKDFSDPPEIPVGRPLHAKRGRQRLSSEISRTDVVANRTPLLAAYDRNGGGTGARAWNRSAPEVSYETDDDTYEQQQIDYQELPPEPRHLEGNDWLILACGPVIALLIMQIPLLNHIFMTFTTLVHEMGHTLTGWIFGYPALPAFDLRYGGGVTATMPRSTLLLMVFYAVMGYLVYLYRKNRLTLIFLVVFLVVHIGLAATAWHDVVFLFMGHGMELVIAGIFFYRALSGAAVLNAAERPLYSVISWFIVMSDLKFAYRLATSVHVRRMYEEAKGGGHWMDFSRIAEDYLHTDLRVVAIFFFLTTLLPLVLGYLAFRYQEYLRVLVTRMWVRDPSQPCVCRMVDLDERNA